MESIKPPAKSKSINGIRLCKSLKIETPPFEIVSHFELYLVN